MGNMSYCRFQNTASDLDDCVNVVEEMMAGEGKPLSREELAAAKDLAARAFDLLQMLAEHESCEIDDLGQLLGTTGTVLEHAIDRMNAERGGET